MHIENAQNGPIHAPKTANINAEKLDSLQHLTGRRQQSRRTKTANIMIVLRNTVTVRQCAAKKYRLWRYLLF